ncbi:MAG: peptidase T [Erysipelotrichaceae bacterium]|nr:peptidase T [Erysipelotrichaceae bacterium]
MVNQKLKERFLKYISFDTQSCEEFDTIPSTEKQKDLAKYLNEELKLIGIKESFMDECGYVYGYLPSNCNSSNTIGLIAHLDTSDEASGENIKPQVISNYDGGVILLNEKLNLLLDPKEFEYLNLQIGHELITTDGTTLLGADDKAGIAIIMTVVEELLKSDIEYPNIIITFTPDEEIGRGTNAFNYDYYKEKGCSIAYTLDGGEPNVINYENFNAASCVVKFNGKSIHPGSAKNKMINASLVAIEFNDLLPKNMLPSLTENYEGFNHLVDMTGSVSEAQLVYIIRNHDLDIFIKQKELFNKAEEYLNWKYGYNVCEVVIKDSYFNMKDIVLKNPEVLRLVESALIENNLVPKYEPIRGGTDGARLTFEGIITPNLGTGGQNYHGPFEYLDVDESSIMVNVVKSLLKKHK